MKVLHISTGAAGGAGVAMLRIHKALQSQGVSSKVLVRDADGRTDVTVSLPPIRHGFFFATKQGRLIRRLLHKAKIYINDRDFVISEYRRIAAANPFCFTIPVSDYDLAHHPMVEEADIIHLHWVEDFLDYPSFFREIKKPIIWTFHDYNAVMGGFHHVRFRDNNITKYGALEQKCLDIKVKTFKQAANLYPIAISSVMHKLLENSQMFDSRNIFDIPNCVDTNTFNIKDRNNIRSKYNIAQDSYVILFANGTLNNSEKGLNEFIKAMSMVELPADILVLLVGDGMVPECRLPIRHISRISDSNTMADIYNIADLLVFPSRQEAFPLTPLEAMSCGIPVVMTPVSGASDMLTQNTGIITKDYSPESIACAIKEAYNTMYNYEMIRQHILDRYTLKQIGEDYIRVYNKILGK